MVGEIRVGEAETAYEMNANPPPPTLRSSASSALCRRYQVGKRHVQSAGHTTQGNRRLNVIRSPARESD